MAFIIIFLSCNAISFAQNNKTAQPDINAIVDSMMYGNDGFVSNKKIIGASIGVYYDGKTYNYSYGYADREKKIKVNNATQFEIGSNTKVFTGLMLSSEIAQGKMDSNDFIEKYVEVNPNIKHKVRLTDIANHISGLPTFHDSESLAELMAQDTTKDPLSLVTDAYMLSVLKKVDSLHNYGQYEYSNFAVGILGYILQKKEHTSYDKILQAIICKPLGLNNTTASLDTISTKVAKVYAHGERAPYIALCNTMLGAGAIKSDITDMMTFIKFQLHGNPLMNDALTISQKKYYNGEHLQIAMGWHIGDIYNSEIYTMRGDTYGASSLMMFDKAHKIGLVVLLNSANSGVVERCQNTFLAKVLNNTSDFQKRFQKPAIIINKTILEKYAGIYELQPGFDGTVTIEDGQLYLQLTGQPRGMFKSVEENWFTMEKYNCQLEFEKNDNGVCNTMVIHQNGQDISCKRK